MLWKDFAGKETCDGCPLIDAGICLGRLECHGGEPIEPPCCSFDDNTDLDQWVDEWVSDRLEMQRWLDELEDARIEADRVEREQAKKERAKKASDTRRAMRRYCQDEIRTLKSAQKELEAQKAAERFALSLAEAVNFTNELFRYKERVAAKPEISERVQQLEAKVAEAKEKYNAKRKEFYAKQKGGEGNDSRNN